MLIPSWIRKMNIVLFERNALVDKSFVRSKAVDLLTLWCKSYMTGIDGWYLDASFKTLFDKIAAELLWQNSWKVWTEVLSSRMKQFFLSDMPVLGLFNYRLFLQCLKVLIAGIFQVVKSFCFTNVGSVRNFISRNSAKVQNYSNCL